MNMYELDFEGGPLIYLFLLLRVEICDERTQCGENYEIYDNSDN